MTPAASVIRLVDVVAPPPADVEILAREIVALRRERDQVVKALDGKQLDPPGLTLAARVVNLQVHLEREQVSREAREAELRQAWARIEELQRRVVELEQSKGGR